MIRFPIVRRIFRRELLDTLRDWNMLCIVVVVPFILMPVAMLTMVEVAWQSASDTLGVEAVKPGQKKGGVQYKVALVGSSVAEFQEKASAQKQLKIVPLPDFTLSDSAALRRIFSDGKKSPEAIAYREKACREIADGTVDAILVCGESSGSELKNFWLVILSDETIPRSKKAAAALERITEEWRKQYRADRLKARGETEASLRPLFILTEQLAPLNRQLVYLFSSAAPAIFSLLLLSGCFYAAVQSIPGEKERGTLATILSAPVRPLELLFGKWMNVMSIGIIGALSYTGSLLFTLVIIVTTLPAKIEGVGGKADSVHEVISNLNFTWEFIPWGSLALLALALIFLTMVFSALSLVVCMFARGANDASYLLTPVIAVLCIPAGLAGLPTMEWSVHTALTPVLGNALLIREIFRQAPLQPTLLALSFLSCFVFSFALLIFGARIFEKEGVRFTAPSGSTRFFSRPASGAVGSGVSFIAALLLLAGAFYFALAASGMSPRVQAFAMQAWLVAVPIGLLWYLRIPWAEALAWRGVSWPALLGALFVGLSAWVAAMPFAVFFPMPEEMARTFYEVLKGLVSGTGGVFLGLLTLALLPAICEEVAFRGMIQTGLHRRFSPGVTLVLTSLCFGLAHFSIYRFLPTFILGLILSWVRWRTGSLFPGMIIHGLNNGLVVLTLVASSTPILTPELPPWPVLAGGGLMLVFGLAWTAKTVRPRAGAA